MITVSCPKINSFFEDEYYNDYSPLKRDEDGTSEFQERVYQLCDEFNEEVDVRCLTCPDCGQTDAVGHGYYERYLRTALGLVKIKVMRIKCRHCGKTHAVVPLFVVPYSWIMLRHQVMIACDRCREVIDELPSLSESDVWRLKDKFKRFWKQKILSGSIPLDPDGCLDTSEGCLSLYGEQFMHVRLFWKFKIKIRNILIHI